jgi:hypothetical protein
MSFVDLMANHVWSEQDIVNRTEAMILSIFPLVDQTILQRKVTASLLGAYTLTAVDQAELQQFTALSMEAKAQADAARADMQLLQRVLEAEAGIADGSILFVGGGVSVQLPADVLELLVLRNPQGALEATGELQ